MWKLIIMLFYKDLNECDSSSVCQGGRCVNTQGSFRCECFPGLVLGPDGRTCLGKYIIIYRMDRIFYMIKLLGFV
jgi:hypothetical protein